MCWSALVLERGPYGVWRKLCCAAENREIENKFTLLPWESHSENNSASLPLSAFTHTIMRTVT